MSSIQRYLEQGVTDEGGQDCVAAMMHQATGRVRTDIVLMPICDAISLLAECNIHHHIDYSAPVSNTSWPHICFPFGAVSPAACLINALSARVMCQSTAEVCIKISKTFINSTPKPSLPPSPLHAVLCLGLPYCWLRHLYGTVMFFC